MSVGSLRNHSMATNGVEDLYNFLPQLLPPGSGPEIGNFNTKYENRKGHGGYSKGHKGGHGWDSGGYGHGGGYGGGSGSSPAISALALLGFLFFLNLIQNSLTFNRIFLSSTQFPIRTNTTTTTGGSSTVIIGRTGRERQKRGLNVEINNQAYSDPIPSQPIHHLLNKTLEQFESNEDTQVEESQMVNCFQLLACQLGKNAYAQLGRSSRRTFLHFWKMFIKSDNGSEWSNDVLWALKRGGKKKKCQKMFWKC